MCWVSGNGKTTVTAVGPGAGVGGRGLSMRKPFGATETLDLDHGGGYVASYVIKTHSTVLLRRANFTVNYTSINPTFL